jgi:acylphosphatase
VRRRYLIGGRVQGVGFRFFAQRIAVRLGLRGWVRNLPDGGVELEAQGDLDSLTALESALRQGPRGAQVTQFEPTEISDELDDGTPFTIG